MECPIASLAWRGAKRCAAAVQLPSIYLGTTSLGVRAAVEPIQSSARYLTDSHNYVWVYGNKSGFVDMITRYGCNNPTKILQAIAEAFGTDIFSEHEPQFWGFQTQEEWDAAWGARTK
jgi:hypothetical protein